MAPELLPIRSLELVSVTIRQFLPLSVAVIAALSIGAKETDVPAVPIAVIAIVAAILLLLQVEDHRLGNLLSDLIRALRDHS
jgi:hypothetical protein